MPMYPTNSTTVIQPNQNAYQFEIKEEAEDYWTYRHDTYVDKIHGQYIKPMLEAQEQSIGLYNEQPQPDRYLYEKVFKDLAKQYSSAEKTGDQVQPVFQFNTFNIVNKESGGLEHSIFSIFLLIVLLVILILVSIVILLIVKMVWAKNKKKNKNFSFKQLSNQIMTETIEQENLGTNQRLVESDSSYDRSSTRSMSLSNNANQLCVQNDMAKSKRFLSDKNSRAEGREDNPSKAPGISRSNSRISYAEDAFHCHAAQNIAQHRLSSQFIRKIAQHNGNASQEDDDQKNNLNVFFENNKFKNSFTNSVPIGSGSYGEVFKAMHKLEGYYYAVKRIDLMLRSDEELRNNIVFREVNAMVNLNHKNIVRFITSWLEKDDSLESSRSGLRRMRSNSDTQNDETYSLVKKPAQQDSLQNSNFEIVFEDTAKLSAKNGTKSLQSKNMRSPVQVTRESISLYIQMELCSGNSLGTFLLNQDSELLESDAFFIFAEILSGLCYIHSRGVIHRDLKPGNIFITSKGEIKIGDFGLATITPNELLSHCGDSQHILNESSANLRKAFEKLAKNFNSSKIGTPFYIAPEQENSNTYDSKADIYSLGIILFELLNCFRTAHEKVRALQNLKNTHRISDDFKNLHPHVSTLVEMLIKEDPELRPTAQEIWGLEPFIRWSEKLIAQEA